MRTSGRFCQFKTRVTHPKQTSACSSCYHLSSFRPAFYTWICDHLSIFGWSTDDAVRQWTASLNSARSSSTAKLPFARHWQYKQLYSLRASNSFTPCAPLSAKPVVTWVDTSTCSPASGSVSSAFPTTKDTYHTISRLGNSKLFERFYAIRLT